MMRSRMIFIGYTLASIALFLFSYTQVDLNLTLSRVSIWQGIQKAFQHVGFYERPTALGIYMVIVAFFFGLYFYLIYGAKNGKISKKHIWRIIFIVTGILVCSYPAAFSYDFFNYLFTAKTVLVYRQNPYMVTPLQFAGIDSWTNFMRWTHLSSAYTPLWIGLSIFPYIFGLGYFVPVLFATKGMIAVFYLLSSYMLMKIMDTVNSKYTPYVLTLFACNPLIIIETLVSGHNDIVLVAFAMISVLYYVTKRPIAAFWYLGLSVATKLMTIFIFPVYVLKKGRMWMAVWMMFGVGLVLLRREFLPWYWVWVVPFIALNPERIRLIRFMICVSFGLVMSYAPYIYFGEYSVAEQMWKMGLIWGGICLSVLVSLIPVRTNSIL